jgi:hypothetical protein
MKSRNLQAVKGYGLDAVAARVGGAQPSYKINISMTRLNRMIADAKATGMQRTVRELLRFKQWKLQQAKSRKA